MLKIWNNFKLITIYLINIQKYTWKKDRERKREKLSNIIVNGFK